MQDYKLSDIYIYPIKSLGAISLDNTKTTEKGLQYDRRWMLVDADNKFMTIRRYPEFLFFRLEKLVHEFNISYDGASLEIPFAMDAGELVKCAIWNDKVDAIKGNETWNQWFSEKLGVQCSLVYMPEESERKIKPVWGATNVSFADGYPLLVAGSASLRDLNQTIGEPMEIMRFRPNLVFNGGKGYDEFKWGAFNIGSTGFQGLKPCTRCIVTTYHPTTGEKGREPLLTLSRQKVNDNIVFGQHAKSLELGEITVGDTIEILDYKSEPYATIPGLSH